MLCTWAVRDRTTNPSYGKVYIYIYICFFQPKRYLGCLAHVYMYGLCAFLEHILADYYYDGRYKPRQVTRLNQHDREYISNALHTMSIYLRFFFKYIWCIPCQFGQKNSMHQIFIIFYIYYCSKKINKLVFFLTLIFNHVSLKIPNLKTP